MRGRQEGITLIELLVALAIFAVVAVGTLGVLGATNAGGLLEGFPVAFSTGRTARDITAATTYLQTLHEYIEKLGSGGVTPGTYCAGSCSGETPLPAGYPTPSSEGVTKPYQLDWIKVVVKIELWGWNGGSPGQYALSPGCTGDCLVRVESTLTWQLKDATRTVTLQRFLKPQ